MNSEEIALLCESLTIDDHDEPAIDLAENLQSVGERKLALNLGESTATMSLKYERLSEFCFHCGFLDHSIHECVTFSGQGRGASAQEFKCGVWLRASSPGRNNARNICREDVRGRLDADRDPLFLMAPSNPPNKNLGV
ncbi:hypothetical protein ACOSQ3_023567 [Xanthoceras sorbifolium]